MKTLQVSAEAILDEVTSTGAGNPFPLWGDKHTVQAIGSTSAGSGSAVIRVEVSSIENPSSDADWLLAGTITLTLGTTETSDGFLIDAPWKWIRGKVSTLTGTDAVVTLSKGDLR